jgi:hypothetical protein
MMKKIPLYLISILLFMVILPILSIVVEWVGQKAPLNWLLVGKWFLFWSVGIRLFIAGGRQVSKPAFTAREIFHLGSDDSFPIIRELGFANLSMGSIAILSLFFPGWRMPAAVAGGAYFGLAGLLHVFKKPDSKNEVIAMISDLYIFILMVCFVISGSLTHV